MNRSLIIGIVISCIISCSFRDDQVIEKNLKNSLVLSDSILLGSVDSMFRILVEKPLPDFSQKPITITIEFDTENGDTIIYIVSSNLEFYPALNEVEESLILYANIDSVDLFCIDQNKPLGQQYYNSARLSTWEPKLQKKHTDNVRFDGYIFEGRVLNGVIYWNKISPP